MKTRPSPASLEYFIPCKTWKGTKTGYYFGTNKQGTGYYRDDNNDNNHSNNHGSNKNEPARKRAKVVAFNEDRNSTLTIPSNAQRQQQEEQEIERILQHRGGKKESSTSSAAATIDGNLLLEQAEKEAHRNKQCIIELTPKGIKTACTALRKAYEKNQLARAQSNDDDDEIAAATTTVVDPSQYMESEITLFEHISSFKSIAANPLQLYPVLLRQEGVFSAILPQLLMHDNSDIVISVISLLLEWLDPNLLEREEQEQQEQQLSDEEQKQNVKAIARLAQALLQNCLELIVANLGRLDKEQEEQSTKKDTSTNGEGNDDDDDGNNVDDDDEDDDDDVGKGQEDVLSLIENILEIEEYVVSNNYDHDDAPLVPRSTTTIPTSLSVAAYMILETPIVSWLFTKIELLSKQKNTTTKGNTMISRCLEILALLLKNEDVYTIHPNWTKLPVYTSTFTDKDNDNDGNNRSNKMNGKNVIKEEEDDNDNGEKKKNKNKEAKQQQYVDGLEILLLYGIAPFRKKQPINEQQLEILENTSTIIELGLTYSPQENIKEFIDAQGIELAIRCIKERVHAGKLCLSWLDFSSNIGSTTSSSSTTNGGDDKNNNTIYKQACEYMITNAGILKHLFPLYMGRQIPKPAKPSYLEEKSSSNNKKQKREWYKHIEQQSIRILYTLIKYIDEHSPQDCQQRILGKFLDGDEKIDRFVELLLSYDKKTRVAEYRFYRSDREEQLLLLEQGEESAEEIINYAALEAKLRGGGDIFHRLGVIGAFCCIHSKRLHQRILQQLHLQQSGISVLKIALKEFIAILNDDETEEEDGESNNANSGKKRIATTTPIMMTHKQQLQYYYDQI